MSIYNQIRASVEEATKIVITSHRSPDGDSVGSSMALYHVLTSLGKEVVV